MRKFVRWISPSISTIVGLALTYYLWFLQEAYEEASKNNTIIKYGTYALILSIIIAILPSITEFLYNERVLKDWLKMQMAYIRGDKLAGDDTKPRVSIYRTSRGIFLIWKYLFWTGPHLISLNWKLSRTWLYWKNAPWVPWAKYNYLWERDTDAIEHKSQSVFPFVYRGDSECGIVCHCLMHRDIVIKKTPIISDIKLPKSKPSGKNDSKSKRILDYMKTMLIDETNYGYLRNMNSRMCRIIAVPLRKPNGKCWGALVVESDMQAMEEQTFSDVQVQMETMSTSFSNLYKALKYEN